MPVTFANTIDGNDIYAKRAECDAAGNTLSTTYATKAELPEGVPPVTSSDNNKVLKASYSEGTGSYSWQTESGGGGAQADWTESDPVDPSYIQNKPSIVGIAAGSNVSITEANNTLTIAATDTTYSAGTGIDITSGTISVDTTTVAMKTDIPSVPVTDVTVDGTSVVSNGTAAITLPTVPTTDQTYNSSSTNPQSGTAVAGAISGVAQVPPVTSSDDTKVLTASYTGGVGSYSWQTAQGGGGGTSNVTTADKQINVAVNGTGVPMQLNLLNPVAEGTANLGIPTVSAIEYPNPNSLVNQYAVMLDWTFSKSAIDFSIPPSGGFFPLTLTISNNTTIVQGSERTYDSDSGQDWPMISSYTNPPRAYLLDAADDEEITSQSMQGVVSDVGGASAQPPGDIQFNAGTYYGSNGGFPVYINDPSDLESASTLKLRIGLFPYKSYVSGQGFIPCTQSEVETFAARVSQNASNFTLTAPSANPTGYTAYIGATSISGQTTTADSNMSGLYRYDFSAAQTASLVPGTYLVQADGPSTSGNQTTYVYLYKNGNTGYSYYTYTYKATYMNNSGQRREMFLMKVDENTTAIGTKVSYGQFTMVRLA